MKKINIICLVVFVSSFLFSCGTTTRRTNCRGNGSWSGKRNLGAIDQKQKQQTYIAFETVKEIESVSN